MERVRRGVGIWRLGRRAGRLGEAELADEVLLRLKARAEGIRVADPFDPEVAIVLCDLVQVPGGDAAVVRMPQAYKRSFRHWYRWLVSTNGALAGKRSSGG
mgnify:CR=1 FL=1